MKLIDRTVEGYLSELASVSPAPGGGSAAALSGAQGAALIIMVCDLTLTRKKYEEYHEKARQVRFKAEILLDKFIKAIDDDTDAYNKVSEAFKRPKTDNRRYEAIEEATIGATKVPLETMKLAYGGAELLQELMKYCNRSAISDLGVAANCFDDALKSAWLNVLINLPSLSKRKEFEDEARSILEKTRKLTQEAGSYVEEILEEKLK